MQRINKLILEQSTKKLTDRELTTTEKDLLKEIIEDYLTQERESCFKLYNIFDKISMGASEIDVVVSATSSKMALKLVAKTKNFRVKDLICVEVGIANTGISGKAIILTK